MLQPEGVKEQENLVCRIEQILVWFKEDAQVFVQEIWFLHKPRLQ